MRVSETKQVKITLACFTSLTAADLSPKDDFDQLFNPLSTGQSKIGRRRPISLDYHCVNISQRNFINKTSLERSFHYLNADTLFLKIGQEMTPLQPFEVTQLIDIRARSIDERDLRPRLRSLHYYGSLKRLEMYTANDGKDPSCRLAKERTSWLLHRRRTIGFSVSVLGRRLPSLRTMYLRRLKRFFVILSVVGCAMRRPFQRCV